MPNLRVIFTVLALGSCEFYASPELAGADTGRADFTPPTDLPTDLTGEPYTGPLVLTYLQADCSGGWVLEARTAGWTTRATIDIWEGTERHEAHSLATLESGPWGHWDQLVRTLRIAANQASWERDVVTGWACEETPELTFAVRIYDTTDTLADCGAWGSQRENVATTLLLLDDVGRREELSGCTIW